MKASDTSVSLSETSAQLKRALNGEHVPRSDMHAVIADVVSGEFDPVALGALLCVLRLRGETSEEMAGTAEAILEASRPLSFGRDALDVVGTGGDMLGTVNISSMAAVVAAGAGAPVVKHGGRSASSRSGSADVLEALGIKLALSPSHAEQCLQEVGIAFIFAPHYHPGLRHVAPVRRSLGVPTIFNFVGPLVNPTKPNYGCVGCSSLALAPRMAEAFQSRGGSPWIVRGQDGLDEVSIGAPTDVWAIRAGKCVPFELDVKRFGVPRSDLSELLGGEAQHNARIFEAVLNNQASLAVRNSVIVNAAVALASRISADCSWEDAFAIGVEEASRSIDEGYAARVFSRWRAWCESVEGDGEGGLRT